MPTRSNPSTRRTRSTRNIETTAVPITAAPTTGLVTDPAMEEAHTPVLQSGGCIQDTVEAATVIASTEATQEATPEPEAEGSTTQAVPHQVTATAITAEKDTRYLDPAGYWYWSGGFAMKQDGFSWRDDDIRQNWISCLFSNPRDG